MSRCTRRDYGQLRVACQRPLQLSPENLALQRPAPVLPASRPLPVATDAPAEILHRDAAAAADAAGDLGRAGRRNAAAETRNGKL